MGLHMLQYLNQTVANSDRSFSPRKTIKTNGFATNPKIPRTTILCTWKLYETGGISRLPVHM